MRAEYRRHAIVAGSITIVLAVAFFWSLSALDDDVGTSGDSVGPSGSDERGTRALPVLGGSGPSSPGGRPTPSATGTKDAESTAGRRSEEGNGTAASSPPIPQAAYPRLLPSGRRQGRFLPIDASGQPIDDVVLVGSRGGSWSPVVFWADGPQTRISPERQHEAASDPRHAQSFESTEKSQHARSLSIEWIARAPESSHGESKVVLDPAAWVVVRVVDEAGAPVPRFDVQVRDSSGNGQGFKATRGGFVLQWRRIPGEESEIDATLMVAAERYAPVVHDVRIPADRRSTDLTLTMTRAEESVLRWSAPNGKYRTTLSILEVQLRSPRRPDWVALRRPASWIDDTTIEAKVPSGDWGADLRVWRGRDHVTLWASNVTLVPGRIAEFVWSPPADFDERLDAASGGPTSR